MLFRLSKSARRGVRSGRTAQHRPLAVDLRVERLVLSCDLVRRLVEESVIYIVIVANKDAVSKLGRPFVMLHGLAPCATCSVQERGTQ